jgi:hypothetical protein
MLRLTCALESASEQSLTKNALTVEVGSLLAVARRRGTLPCIFPVGKPVGSRTGAVFRRSGLSVAPRFLWECLTSQTVNPFPAPAASHPACRFPALGAPVCLVPRVMGPIVPGRLSHLAIDATGSR